MIQRSLAVLLLLSACNPASSNNSMGNAVAASPAEAPPAQAESYKDEDKNDLMSWSLMYPAEVAAIPAMASAIRAKFDKSKSENLTAAKEQKIEMSKGGYDFPGYEQSDSYEVVGNTPKLLSVEGAWYRFTGGAHPNHGTSAILWDQAARRKVALGDLLQGGTAAFERLYRTTYCKALDAERKTRREGAGMDSDPSDPFNACPKFEELAIIPRAAKVGAPLVTLTFHADPYVAGPYVEGDYDIALPVTADFLAALKPAYRSSFVIK